jgi:hypothetical protein
MTRLVAAAEHLMRDSVLHAIVYFTLVALVAALTEAVCTALW